MDNKNNYLPWLFIMILSLVWGSSFILMKRGLVLYAPQEVGALRIFSAGLFLLPVAIRKAGTLKKSYWKKLFLVGLMGSFFPAFLFAWGQTKLISSVAGMLNALTPIIVVVIGVWFYKQKVRWVPGIGLFLGLAGTGVLLFSGQNGGFGQLNAYTLLIVAAVISYSINLNFVKYHLSGVPALTITSVALALIMPFAGIYLFGFTDFTERLINSPIGPQSAGYIVLLGVMGTAMALVLFNKLVQMTTPLFTSLVTYFIPIVAVLWGIADQESLHLLHFVGLLIIIAGVYLVNYSKYR